MNEGWLNFIKRSINRKSLDSKFRKEVEKRVEICSACPMLKVISKSNGRLHWGMCRKCGCVFPALVYSKSKSCPEEKWKSIPE